MDDSVRMYERVCVHLKRVCNVRKYMYDFYVQKENEQNFIYPMYIDRLCDFLNLHIFNYHIHDNDI